MNGNRIGVLALAGMIGAGAAYVAVASGQGVAARPGSNANIDRWEYGMLTINERTATLQTANRTTWLDLVPPYALDATVFQRGQTVRFRADYNPALSAMNHFGAEGWELVGSQDLRTNVTMTVRRER